MQETVHYIEDQIYIFEIGMKTDFLMPHSPYLKKKVFIS
jgi:hypothetical protein